MSALADTSCFANKARRWQPYHRKRWHDVRNFVAYYVYFAHTFAKYIKNLLLSQEIFWYTRRESRDVSDVRLRTKVGFADAENHYYIICTLTRVTGSTPV